MIIESIILPSSYNKQLKLQKKAKEELQEEQRLLTLNVIVCFAYSIEKLFR